MSLNLAAFNMLHTGYYFHYMALVSLLSLYSTASKQFYPFGPGDKTMFTDRLKDAAFVASIALLFSGYTHAQTWEENLAADAATTEKNHLNVPFNRHIADLPTTIYGRRLDAETGPLVSVDIDQFNFGTSPYHTVFYGGFIRSPVT